MREIVSNDLVVSALLCARPFSVPLRLPTQPLPPPPALQQVVTTVQTNKANNLDVLAHTLKLADLDFDFEPAEPVRGGGGSSLVPPSETQVCIVCM
mgnify:FL=1